MIRNESMKIDVLERISEALNVSVSYWFDSNDYLPAENTDASQPTIIEKKGNPVSPKHIDAVTNELNKLLKELNRR